MMGGDRELERSLAGGCKERGGCRCRKVHSCVTSSPPFSHPGRARSLLARQQGDDLFVSRLELDVYQELDEHMTAIFNLPAPADEAPLPPGTASRVSYGSGSGGGGGVGGGRPGRKYTAEGERLRMSMANLAAASAVDRFSGTSPPSGSR